MLTDRLKLKFIAGTGGNGVVRFAMSRKPDGGDGGKGGDVILEGTTNVYDLAKLTTEEVYKAENGDHGGGSRKRGKNGNDLIIKVPLITEVFNLENKKIMTIEKDGQREVIVEGGRGGLGNYNFRRGQVQTLRKHTNGEKGEEIKVILELKLAADIVFIGFPNAGKSSMLNALTNADVKVAPYPFTTLEPHLGVAKGMILMDLPGLIEGTSKGKGLGTGFRKHTERAKAVAHFISLESENIINDYETMRKELEEIDERLSGLPEIIVLSKSDMVDEKKIEGTVSALSSFNKNIISASAFKYDELSRVTSAFSELLKST